MIPDADSFLKLISNREQVIAAILADMDSCAKNAEAFAKLCELFDAGKEVSTEKALKAAAKSLRHSNEVNRRMMFLLLVYVSGSHFTGDAAGIMVKLGRGEEALKAVFDQKLKGR
jgi:hypothetical protein